MWQTTQSQKTQTVPPPLKSMQGISRAPTMNQQANRPQPESTSQTVNVAPPTMVSSKDLAYLEDEMNWFLVAAKKCAHFANECTDTDVKTCITQIGQSHERHYQLLLQYLQTNNGSQTGTYTNALGRN